MSGDVEYTSTGFVGKNDDALVTDLCALITATRDPFVAMLMEPKLGAGSSAQSASRGRGGGDGGGGGGRRGGGKGKAKKMMTRRSTSSAMGMDTVGSSFKDQVGGAVALSRVRPLARMES
jgi:myosin heavy subunit